MRTSLLSTFASGTLILAVCLAANGAPVDVGTPASMGGMRFSADVSVAPAANGEGTITVDYSVTYDALHFLRHEGGYRARFEITAILYDTNGRQVTGDSWRRTVRAATYDETNERRTAATDEFLFAVPPGRYTLKLELTSIDTRATGQIERTVTVPRMKPGELTLGTVLFETNGSDATQGEVETVPNPSRVYGEDKPDVRVIVPVYGTPDSRYAILMTVKDERGLLKKSHRDSVVQSDFLREYVFEFNVLDLDVGPHVLEVEVFPSPQGRAVSAKSRFRVVTSPLSWGEDEEKMLAQISYVATRDEMDMLTSVPPEERGPVWDEFWAGRDPDPATAVNEFKAEFLRRLGYANGQFRSIVDGWQTDMGRVYIQQGEPDDVDSQPVGQMLNAWEIWYYYTDHTKYVFVDREGFGEFVLHEVSRI
ncbi:MAG: GWxTD domain-containing protein [Candidatus Eisenbacteria bacterium]